MNSRLPTVIFCLIGALILFLLFFPAMNHPWPGRPLAKSEQEVVSLTIALRHYWTEYGEFPRGDTVNVLKVLQAQNVDSQNPRKIVFLEFKRGDLDIHGRFLDGWGHPIVIEFSSDRQQVTIKSYGENGKDDGGKGDDIVEIVTPPATK